MDENKDARCDRNKYYDNCLRALNDCRKSSEGDFENKITYITAGALGLSISFFKGYSLHSYSWVLLVSWWLLTISLLLNCWSALHIKSMCVKVATEVRQTKANEWCKNFNRQVDKVTRISDWYNRITIFCSIVGIMAVVLFATLNFTNMEKENKQRGGVVDRNDWSDTTQARDRIVKIQDSRGIDTPIWPSSIKDDGSGTKGGGNIEKTK